MQFCVYAHGTACAPRIGVNASAESLPTIEAPLASPAPCSVSRTLELRKARARWPVLACAVVGLSTGIASFLESPLAEHPAIAPFATTVRDRACAMHVRVGAMRAEVRALFERPTTRPSE